MVERRGEIKIRGIMSSSRTPEEVIQTIKTLAPKETSPEQLLVIINSATAFHIAKKEQKPKAPNKLV